MKRSYLFSIFFLSFSSVPLHAQTDVYSQPIIRPGVNFRGAVTVLGSVNTTFPSDGYVVVHFDGECYADVGDRIVLAASNNGDWGTNDGNVSVETSEPGFGRPFSHTRVYPATAGQHTYYAVGQNSVELDGSGIATVYGTLTVEYFPDSGASRVKSTGFVFNGDVTNTIVVAQQSIHVDAPGKMVIRFDGFLTSDQSDRIILAASNTMDWSFNDGAVAVEAVNKSDVDGNSFSHTRVYNVPSAGDYTYYAVSQRWGETDGDGLVWIYGNLLVEYYPSSAPEKILSDGFSLTEIDLNSQPTTLTSLVLDAQVAGKVMVVLSGYLTANEGYDIVLAASNTGDWSANDGNITLQALDNDNNRYSFSHTRVYNISAGSHTYYAIGEIFGGSGSETADLFGFLTVKYFPSGPTAVSDLSAEKNTFDIYPNPSSDVVHITFKNPADHEQKIQILDLNGRVLMEKQNHSNESATIDLSTFPANLYWVKVDRLVKPILRM